MLTLGWCERQYVWAYWLESDAAFAYESVRFGLQHPEGGASLWARDARPLTWQACSNTYMYGWC